MVKLPPPIWMFLFLAIAYGLGIAFPRLEIADLSVVPLGIALTIIGVILGASSVGLFRIERTEINPVSAENKKLVTRGPYRFTRNPMYLSLVLFSLGIAFWTGLLPMFAVPVLVFAVANWVHIPFEETKMRRQFGPSFDAYAARVRPWI